MTIRDWILHQEIEGHMTFSFALLNELYSCMSEQSIKNELYRLVKKGLIVSVYKGFYCIIPAHFRARGIVPVTFYVDQLFDYLQRPYYLSLLSAAEFHGAAHQRPQRAFVTTTLPVIQVSGRKNPYLSWIFRKEIHPALLNIKNSENGIIKFSNPELTAVDLVLYEKKIGGLSMVATVLEELIESTDFNRNFEELASTAPTSVFQRLGYITDKVLKNEEQAEIVYQQLTNLRSRLDYVPLKIGKQYVNCEKDNKWKIIINQEIEIDEI